MKRFATIIVALVVLAGSAMGEAKWGGVARQLAMGGAEAASQLVLNPFILQDPTMMLLDPAYLSVYKDYVWMNIGGGTLVNVSTPDNGFDANGIGKQFSGINFSLSKEFTVGATLSYDPSGVNIVGNLIQGIAVPGGPTLPPFTQRAAQTIPKVTNVFEGLVAYDMGDLDIGFGVTMGWANNNSTASTTQPTATSNETEASARMFGFRAGLVYDLGGGSFIDLGAGLRMDKATDNITSNAGSGGEYSASGTEFLFAARAGLKVSNKVTFVPYGILGLLSAEPKEDSFPVGRTAQKLSEKLTTMAIALGVGAEYHVPNFLLAGGLSYKTAKAKLEASQAGVAGSATSTYTVTAIPVFNLGAEWLFTDWLAGRAGYFRALGKINIKTETPNATNESNQTFNNSAVLAGGIGPATWDGVVTLGIGLRFGNFSMDATVSEEALRRGLGLFGPTDNLNTFGYMTTSYNFH